MNNARYTLSLMIAAILAASGASANHDTLFAAMGGTPVLHTAVDRFTEIVVDDKRINFTFAEADLPKFRRLLFEQLCNLSGGPCRYTGRDMRTAHAKLGINTAEFNALTEDLYIALGKAGVPYRLQNRLIALLAPMKRDIVKPPHAPDPAFPSPAESSSPGSAP